VKQPKREIAKANNELRSIRQHIYYLNAKEKNTKGKGSKKKKELIRAERELYVQLTQEIVSDLVKRKEAARNVAKIKQKIISDRTKLRQQLKKLDKLAIEAKASGNKKAFDGFIDDKEEIYDAIDATFDAMDEINKEADISGYTPYDEDEEDDMESGFVLWPNSPIFIWEAQDKLQSDIDSGKYEWFIVDGMKISANNSFMALEELRKLRYNDDIYEVDVYYNNLKNAAKYEPVK
jgi:hypothetical protein